jgi:hypothetical protein
MNDNDTTRYTDVCTLPLSVVRAAAANTASLARPNRAAHRAAVIRPPGCRDNSSSTLCNVRAKDNDTHKHSICHS